MAQHHLNRPREKPQVWFNQSLHDQRRVDCRQCHHVYQGKRNLWQRGQPVKKCASCHGVTPQARRPDLKNAFHRQCKSCHLELRGQGKKAGPIDCLDCHRQG